MNKEFIPYEQALELKELGFDEKCFAAMDMYSNIDYGSEMYDWIKNGETVQSTWAVLPLYQQAFRWFREYYGLNGYVGGKSTRHYWQIESFIEEDGALNQSPYWHYTDAQLDCLKKLIEIAKNDTDRRNI